MRNQSKKKNIESIAAQPGDQNSKKKATLHDDPIQGGHIGIAKTVAKVQWYYYWKNNT